MTQFFQYHQLKVTVDTNVPTDFLDFTLNLSTGRYWPYRKPNDQPLYINVQSNHPPLITKKLPCMISNAFLIFHATSTPLTVCYPCMKRRLSKADTRFSRSLLNAQQEGKNLDREEEKLYGSIPHITTGFSPTSGKPSSTFCGNTSLHQTGCIKSATKMSSNSATTVPKYGKHPHSSQQEAS